MLHFDPQSDKTKIKITLFGALFMGYTIWGLKRLNAIFKISPRLNFIPHFKMFF